MTERLKPVTKLLLRSTRHRYHGRRCLGGLEPGHVHRRACARAAGAGGAADATLVRQGSRRHGKIVAYEGIAMHGALLECRRLGCAELRAARANRVFCTDKNHPYRKHGYG